MIARLYLNPDAWGSEVLRAGKKVIISNRVSCAKKKCEVALSGRIGMFGIFAVTNEPLTNRRRDHVKREV